jgi:hypothetical protein
MLSCVAPRLWRVQPSFCQPPTDEIPDATESDDLQSGFFSHTARKSIHYVMDLPKSQLYHIRAMSSLGDELRNGREQMSWEGQCICNGWLGYRHNHLFRSGIQCSR